MENCLIRTYKPGETGLVSHLQMALYEKQYGFKPIFEYYLTAGMAEFLRGSEGSQLWVAESKGKIIGSIAVVKSEENEAHIRWFAVDDSLQGQGLGSRLIDTAMGFCQECGYRHITLWTIEMLKAARHLYIKHGFVLTEKKDNTQWTDHLLIEEKWECYLNK